MPTYLNSFRRGRREWPLRNSNDSFSLIIKQFEVESDNERTAFILILAFQFTWHETLAPVTDITLVI